MKISNKNLFMVMFDVHHVLLREDKENEKYNLEKLIEFNAGTNRRVKPFKTWFGKAHSRPSSFVVYICHHL